MLEYNKTYMQAKKDNNVIKSNNTAKSYTNHVIVGMIFVLTIIFLSI